MKLRQRLTDLINGHVKVEQLCPGAIISYHALNPEKRGDALSARHRPDVMQAGGRVQYQVPRRQLDVIRLAVSGLDTDEQDQQAIVMALDDVADRLARALARGTQPRAAAAWIEGFLSPQLPGSGLVLATSSRLFGLIDGWLSSLPAEYFAEVLPLLRRTTATFSSGERRQIAERVRTGASPVLLANGADLDLERAALVEPVVLTILGVRLDD